MTQPMPSPITDHRLDRLVSQLLAERAEAVAADALPAEAVAERIAMRHRPPIRRTWVVAAAALLTALLLGGALAVGGRLRPPPVPPALLGVEWTGQVRADARTLPVVSMEGSATEGYRWTDGQDTAVDWIDIGEVETGSFRRLEWRFELGGNPPRTAPASDPRRRVVEYGVVLDRTADGVADCLIGLSNETPERGEYRVWVTNLATGATREQVGPPYGSPIDFAPADGIPPVMALFFLGSTEPCDPGRPYARSVRFYAWASMTELGRVTAWDYAPDAGWLDAPDPRDQP